MNRILIRIFCLWKALERVAFGKKLAEQGVVQEAIAKSRIEIEQCRLLVLKTAHMMDTVGNKVWKITFFTFLK